MRPDLSARIARHNEDNARREHEENERVRRAVEHRRTQEEFRKWKEKMGFDLYLTSIDILKRLEQIRDDNMPGPDDDWNDEFCMAIELIPEARRFYEDMAIECTEVKDA